MDVFNGRMRKHYIDHIDHIKDHSLHVLREFTYQFPETVGIIFYLIIVVSTNSDPSVSDSSVKPCLAVSPSSLFYEPDVCIPIKEEIRTRQDVAELNEYAQINDNYLCGY